MFKTGMFDEAATERLYGVTYCTVALTVMKSLSCVFVIYNTPIFLIPVLKLVVALSLTS